MKLYLHAHNGKLEIQCCTNEQIQTNLSFYAIPITTRNLFLLSFLTLLLWPPPPNKKATVFKFIFSD